MIITANEMLRMGMQALSAQVCKIRQQQFDNSVFIDIADPAEFYLLPALISRLQNRYKLMHYRIVLTTRNTTLLNLPGMDSYFINLTGSCGEIAEQLDGINRNVQYDSNLFFDLHRHCRAHILKPIDLRITESLAKGRFIPAISKHLQLDMKTVYSHVGNMKTVTKQRTLAHYCAFVSELYSRVDKAYEMSAIFQSARDEWLTNATGTTGLRTSLKRYAGFGL